MKFKKLHGNRITKERGITLITLVITIIVLMILAGISIGALTEEDGIIKKAEKAKDQSTISAEMEKVQRAYLRASGNSFSEKGIINELRKELGNNIEVSYDRDENGKKGISVTFSKTDNYYFIENDEVRVATREEFSKEITGVYAILYSDGDLRFNSTGKTNEEKIASGATVVVQSEDISKTYMESETSQPWYSYRTNIKSVTFEDKVVPQYTSYWFFGCSNIEKINNMEKLFTNNVINMKFMFDGVSKLKTLDLSTFNTSNVVDMRYMFNRMTALEQIDVSSFDTSKVDCMDWMFQEVKSLKTLDITNFNTSKVTRMNQMFQFASSLEKLDLSNFNTSNVKGMSHMFDRMTNLKQLKFGEEFDTSKVTTMGYMFYGCKNLESLDLSGFNTEKVTTMENMFENCYKIKSLDLSNFNTSSVIKMTSMFYNMNNIETLNISSFDTSKVERMKTMFGSCEKLLNIDMRLATFDKVTEYNDMFLFRDTSIKIIVKDNTAKTWIQDKLGSGVGTVLTVSELT